ncbi:MAG: Phosphoenolpyruvate-protein phosphotransferase [Alphaproteobacteria bacterium ADurb.BinA280]|jgi:phosphotransferase system enzyme I (PtsI)|nr:phosphoenolpyruvate--protein phosphotransferase [Xanthomonadales bacterium]MCC6504795.1 phosphoenolpyruvate--protein phosphotransferase [Aquimonas sp.]OPZ10693.1 MAG: Phosphoenolpyruvate-protein phosphotransferase [Alphaproteobacteria bacterium ADurb.BinA280]
MRRFLHAQGASRGLALGRARVRHSQVFDVAIESISASAIEGEIERLHLAFDVARSELMDMRQKLQGVLAHELGEFLDLHNLILDDPELLHGLDDLIRKANYSADYALRLQRDRLASIFDGIDDPYMRSRREDLDHVIGRVHAALHRNPGSDVIGLAGDVLVADAIAPSELAQLTERGVVAVITSQGSALSHSAILARSLHLPLVVGAHEAHMKIADGDALLVDGASGEIIIEPDAEDLRQFKRMQRETARERKALQRLRDAETITLDGTTIRLFANAESREDVAQAYELGASGVGLYRTEFLFLQGREPPDEEQQFLAYRDLVMGMRGRPVTLRTLDLGADKADSAGICVQGEPNPALGVRGIRLSLAQPGLFRAQMRALLRASAYGKMNILVPMVSCREEVLAVRQLMSHCRDELHAENHAIAKQVNLGIMIEVPAAALALPQLAYDSDFLSVGTNDLVQYLLAMDRGNEALASANSPLHPAVLRVLLDILKFGRKRGIPVAICGEMAGDPLFTRLLLGLGLREFSLHPSNLLELRRRIREVNLVDCQRLCRRLLRARDRSQLEALIHQGNHG